MVCCLILLVDEVHGLLLGRRWNPRFFSAPNWTTGTFRAITPRDVSFTRAKLINPDTPHLSRLNPQRQSSQRQSQGGLHGELVGTGHV